MPDQGGTDVDEGSSDRDGTFMNGADHQTQPVPEITDEMVAAAPRNRAQGRRRPLCERTDPLPPHEADGQSAQAAPRGKRMRIGRASGMANSSPWQRSDAVWREAGVDWVHHETDLRSQPLDQRAAGPRRGEDTRDPAVESAPAGGAARAPAASSRTRAGGDTGAGTDKSTQTGTGTDPLDGTDGTDGPTAPEATAASGPDGVDSGAADTASPSTGDPVVTGGATTTGDGRPSTVRPAPASATRPAAPSATTAANATTATAGATARSAGAGRRAVAVGAGLVLLAGAGGYVLLLKGDDPKRSVMPAAIRADQIFALDPAAKPTGRTHSLDAIAAYGTTVVAVGAERGGPDRGQFLVSSDGGRTWRLGEVRAADGREAPLAEFPKMIAGGAGAWAALGGPDEGTTVWTSSDGTAWTRQPDAVAAAFGPSDQVTGLTRTRSGFVAVGETAPGESGKSDAAQGVVWTSLDGRTWQRTLADQLKLGEVASLDRLAASGDVVVLQGAARKTVSKTVSKKVGNKTVKRKVVETTVQQAFWRSTDGGRTWKAVNIPQGQGSSGSVNGLAAAPGGFHATRDATRTTGTGKRRKVTRYGVLFSSADGSKWSAAGRIEPSGYGSLDRLSGSAAGLAALVRRGTERTANGIVMRSADGKVWRQVATIASTADRGTATGLAVLPSATLVSGGAGQDQAFLTSAETGDLDLTGINGMVMPERTVSALSPNGTGLVAVGSGNGDAAIWMTRDGRAWSRAQGDLGGAGTQRLTGLTSGSKGWIAVGHGGDDPVRPLIVTSGDGLTWRRSTRFPAGEGLTASAVAFGPAGYVVVGSGLGKARVWHSSDLQNWTKGTGDLGDRTAMRDVAATGAGFVAVGTRTKDGAAQPVVWTSKDGRAWTQAEPPALPAGMASGTLSRLAVRGDLVVATGSAMPPAAPAGGTPARAVSYAYAVLSADGGRTWQAANLPQSTAGSALTAITATIKGFAVAATAGLPGRADALLWTSADGRTWRRVEPRGTGLDGPGSQWLTGLALAGSDLVAVGVSADHKGDAPMLWRIPAP